MAVFGVKYPNRKSPPSFSKEHRAKISLANKGKKKVFSQEHKENISKSRTGEKNWNFGKHFSIEHRKKISESNKKIPRAKGENSNNWKGGVSKMKGYNYRVAGRQYLIRRKGAKGTHSFEQWEDLKKFYDFMCLCCKKQEPFISLTRDHVVPLSLGGSDDIKNIQPLCHNCNSRKHAKMIDFRIIKITQQY